MQVTIKGIEMEKRTGKDGSGKKVKEGWNEERVEEGKMGVGGR